MSPIRQSDCFFLFVNYKNLFQRSQKKILVGGGWVMKKGLNNLKLQKNDLTDLWEISKGKIYKFGDHWSIIS